MFKQAKILLPVFLFFAFAIIGFVPTMDVYATNSITQIEMDYDNRGIVTVPSTTSLDDYISAKRAEFIASLEGYNISTIEGALSGYFTNDELGAFYIVKDSVEGTTVNVHQVEATHDQAITSVSFTVKGPVIGSTITEFNYETSDGMIDFTPSGANYTVKGFYISNLPSVLPDGYDEPVSGTVTAGDYYLELWVVAKEGYYFQQGFTLTVNGAKAYEKGEYQETLVYAKVAATDGSGSTSEPTYTVLNGAEQTYNTYNTELLTFRLDIPYSEFLASGHVYVDGELVDPSNYTSEEGSTIIHFKKTFAKALKSGNHTLKVATANGEVTTTFAITKNPNTGNNIIGYVTLLFISLAGFATSILYLKKAKVNE